MTPEMNKTIVRHFMERTFNEGDLTIVDESLVPEGVDHQEPLGTNFATHLKEVITMLRTAFPDLHFEIHDMLAEGELVAFRSTMTEHIAVLFRVAPPLASKYPSRTCTLYASSMGRRLTCGMSGILLV